ncbi:MAG: type II secretion system protein [Clostridiales bacterium]|nr:type II secretion system protein [Clostridiales bacterium]
MRRISKNNKKGFTLLEMMLSIAIILMISGLTVILIVTIKDSFMTVYNQNDSADYAMMFGRGFEQSFLDKVVNEHTDNTFKYQVAEISGHSYRLQCNGNSVFSPAQNRTANDTKDKWLIKMGYKWDESRNMVYYRVYVWDNYYNPGKFVYVYEDGFMLPHFSDSIGEISTSGSAILTGGDGYQADDGDYKSMITFKAA